jgi:membrane-associated phospholipid phosphatase
MVRRLAACWRLKAILSAVAAVLFCVPYFWIEYHPLTTVRTLPLTWLDRVIPFQPLGWVWVYESFYLPLNVIPWLAEKRDDLRRYIGGFALVSLISFTVFLVLPIRGPRPEFADASGAYALLRWIDAPLNCLPSLHAALLIYTLAFGRRILRDEIRARVQWVFVVWAALIFYATLSTKQHYAVDLLAGTALGLAADAWMWRRFRVALSALLQPAVAPAAPLAERS